jgi:hypothetical protein
MAIFMGTILCERGGDAILGDFGARGFSRDFGHPGGRDDRKSSTRALRVLGSELFSAYNNPNERSAKKRMRCAFLSRRACPLRLIFMRRPKIIRRGDRAGKLGLIPRRFSSDFDAD